MSGQNERSVTPGTPNGIPPHLTGFVGRERDIAAVSALIHAARLVTITGAGGSGKTRLAAELAAREACPYTSVAWVDLASLADGTLVAQQIGTALGLPERAGAQPVDVVIAAIGDSAQLLVLDNCEHIVGDCASVVDTLLRACPALRVLATSREALGVASETAWLVPPMAHDDAVQLFVDRARAAAPSFALSDANAASVREICRRLDGIPLAIELAAARVRVLSPDQIAARLDDAFRLLSSGTRTALPRHRTLRATMEWSYNLLRSREQMLLRRLAVFAGNFDLDSVERVCADDGLDVEDVLDSVAMLVEKSLVLMEGDDAEARYRLLETVRQYGRERLVEAGELAALERRHAEHFVGVVEAVAPMLVGGAMAMGLIDRLARDHDNIRAAISWASRDKSGAEAALRLIGGMFWFWYARGQFREARQLTDRALALDGSAHPLHRGRALTSSALAALAQGQYARSTAEFQAAIPLLRDAGDMHTIAVATAKLGAAILLGGDDERAAPVLDEALTFVPDFGADDVAIVFARFWSAWAAYRRGDPDRARELIDANVATARKFNLPVSLAHSLVTLARVELAQGDVEDACRELVEGLELEVSLNDGWGVAVGLDSAAFIAARRGRLDDAARILGGTAAHRERLAVALPVLSPSEDEALNATLRSGLGARYDSLYAEGRALATADVVSIALAEAARHTAEHRAVQVQQGAAPETVASLRVAALGPLQVFVGDRAVEAGAWGSARPRELLMYLLSHPEGRTKEQVGLAFWPEASAAQLRNSFHVTLHRLRKALGGAGWVTLTGDRYGIDKALVQEFDAAVFEREVRDARRALERGDAGAPALLERAIARYRGDFLDGEPVGDWHVEHRDRLQKLYVDALMQLGERLEIEERFAKAAEVYQRVLARDELHESAVLALMRSHVAMGERQVALRLYQRFAETMRRELDAEPQRPTVQFVEKLQRGAVA